MSQEERDRLEWLKRAKDGVISQREAARRMGVTDRWVRKLLKRMKRHGDRVVVHGLRGRASNRKIASQVHAQAIGLLKQGDWPGRVRVLLPDEYNRHTWSFFQTYHGSSWHGKDAKLIFWMGRNWMLLTAAGFMLAALVGLAGWWVYGRILLLGAKGRRTVHMQMESSKVGGSRGPLSRLWRMFLSISPGGETKPRVNYELVEQHDA